MSLHPSEPKPPPPLWLDKADEESIRIHEDTLLSPLASSPMSSAASPFSGSSRRQFYYHGEEDEQAPSIFDRTMTYCFVVGFNPSRSI
jgi:hypothetical protein